MNINDIFHEYSGEWGFTRKDKYPQYEYVGGYNNGYFRVSLNGKWGLINGNGNEVIKVMFQDVRPFHEGLAAVKLNDKWGFINWKGELVINYKYNKVKNFNNGLTLVCDEYKVFCIDMKGDTMNMTLFDAMKKYDGTFDDYKKKIKFVGQPLRKKKYIEAPSIVYRKKYIPKTVNNSKKNKREIAVISSPTQSFVRYAHNSWTGTGRKRRTY